MGNLEQINKLNKKKFRSMPYNERAIFKNIKIVNPQLINKPCNIPIKCNVIPNTNTTTCFANIGNSWAGPPQISCCN